MTMDKQDLTISNAALKYIWDVGGWELSECVGCHVILLDSQLAGEDVETPQCLDCARTIKSTRGR